ncbi:M6 family metalloprotease domain-containing protein [bacterium]|nr:M6 family metalloprotease domain-containing protein [bacterium]
MHARLLTITLTLILVAVPLIARAMEPPEPGMLEQMAAEGTLDDAMEFAKELGNFEMSAPLRGASLGTDDPQAIADMISDHFGHTLNDKSTSAIASSTPAELGWVELDLNHDGTVDERDVLALGQPQPKTTALFPSLGTVKTFCLLIEFSDYPKWFNKSVFETNLFGAGDTYYYYRGLKYYYDQASYSLLNVDGDIHGWYQAIHPRTYYHPNDDEDYPWDSDRRSELVREALLAADANGTDFSQYDNDGDGGVDYFLVVYTGPHGAWSTFWWGYYGVSVGNDFVLDGVTFPKYSWQWERYYGFSESAPALEHWDPKVTIHETGHSLGLPDLYDYDGNQGPDGGVGSLDMMHGNWGDHCCFSKYVLGWLNPTVAFTNLDDEELSKSNAYGDAVVFMPGFDPVSPWSEFFMAQNRYKQGVDQTYPASGLLLWHIDARVNNNGSYLWNNSYTSHKLVRLMEADGLEEIESNGTADAGDYYDDTASTGDDLTPTSTPNSLMYDGTDLSIYCNDISAAGETMTADFTMYSSNPPSVTINDPDGGDTITGEQIVSISASDDNAVTLVQLLIDGQLVEQWTSGPYAYNWNSVVEFNQTLTLTARAWDSEGQAGSDTISVTVSNTGVAVISDNFSVGLSQWRELSDSTDPNHTYIGGVGQFGMGDEPYWTTRTSPATPTPLGSGEEACVWAPATDESFRGQEHLRSQRFNATAFTRPVQVKFYYRATSGLSLWATTDQGATWERLDDVPSSTSWSTFRGVYDFSGQVVYFQLFYNGSFTLDNNSGLSANIDDLLIRQAPSNPPTVTITSHSDSDPVSGSATFAATATDDDTVAAVEFYLAGTLRTTDTTAPYSYTRNTINDDNHPNIPLVVIAIDNDDLVSAPDEVSLAFKNERPYPVYDDLESGTGNWSYSNDSKSPNWALIDDGSTAYSGTHCWAWAGPVTANGNSDYIYYQGFPPTSGRKSIDLSGDNVEDPVLRFMYTADIPSDCALRIRVYNTWDGWTTLAWADENTTGWEPVEFSLDRYIGQSIRFRLFMINDTEDGGTGFWLDDLCVENQLPTILDIDPDRTTAGTTITLSGISFGFSRGTSTVTFADGAVTAQPGDFTSWDNEEIVLTVPADAASGDVVVTVGAHSSVGYDFTVVLAPPVIDDVEQL